MTQKLKRYKKFVIILKQREEANIFAGKFPKSYLAKVKTIGGYDHETNKGYRYYGVSFYFNIFFTNESTGEINESAIKRRAKV
jgi:hypothetical protein